MLTPEGHRGRLRNRFKDNSGLGAFEDHEVLELLLTYAIPRKDTKPIARALLDRFGTLSGTLDADPVDLQDVEGIGEGSAALLHLMPALTRRYLRDRWGHRPRLLTIGRFAVDELSTADYEVFLLVALTHESHVIRTLRLHEGALTTTPPPCGERREPLPERLCGPSRGQGRRWSACVGIGGRIRRNTQLGAGDDVFHQVCQDRTRQILSYVEGDVSFTQCGKRS